MSYNKRVESGMKKKPRLRDYLANGKIYVWKGTYAMVRAERPCRGAVAVIRDHKEVTCLIEESLLRPGRRLAVEGGWKILSFDMVLPFGLVGFLSTISGVLAKAGISLCALSSYSTDHILVKTQDLARALSRLESLGFAIEKNEL
jgi:uncharacterized protein